MGMEGSGDQNETFARGYELGICLLGNRNFRWKRVGSQGGIMKRLEHKEEEGVIETELDCGNESRVEMEGRDRTCGWL